MLQFYKTIHLYLKNKKVSDENMELAIKYYKFIKDYAKAFNIDISQEEINTKNKNLEQIIKETINDLFINEYMLCFLKMNEDEAIKVIKNKLKSENGIIDLLRKIETYIDDQNNYLTELEIIYYHSNENIKEFTKKVKAKYKNNKEFQEGKYYSLFIEYINILNELRNLLKIKR